MEDVTTIKLDNGFECTINKAAFDDWELTELIADLDGIQRLGDEVTEQEAIDGFRITNQIFRKILGVKGYKALKDHVRDKSGRVPPDAMQGLLDELFAKAGEQVKN